MKKSITFTLEPYQIGHRKQVKCVVYNDSKVHAPRTSIYPLLRKKI